MKIQVLQVGSIGTNCYILCDETANVCAVIDPGDEAPLILTAVEKLGCTVDKVLLTHGHYDHTGGVIGLLDALPHLTVYIHRADYEFHHAHMFPLKTRIDALGLDGVRFYDEGDHVAVGTLDVQVLHTPGHSLGSVILQCVDTLFCGDTLFAGACGRTDLPGGNMEEIMASLRRLASLPGDWRVLPGHMQHSTLERERVYNPYMKMAVREQN